MRSFHGGAGDSPAPHPGSGAEEKEIPFEVDGQSGSQTSEMRLVRKQELKIAELSEELRSLRMSNGLEKAFVERVKLQQESMVELDVGGHVYKTSIATLRRHPGSMLDAMFSERYPLRKDEHGRVCIDADGELFKYVLDYLRTGQLLLPELDEYQSMRLRHMFDYFNLVDPNLMRKGSRFFLFAMGGYNGSDWQSHCERYDSLTDRWEPIRPMQHDRASYGLCFCPANKKIYVIGGWDGSQPQNMTERYDPIRGTWERCAPMGIRRSAFALCCIGSKLYAIGGYDGYKCVPLVEEYDVFSDTWEARAPMQEPRRNFAACTVGKKVYIFGGKDGTKRIVKVEVYDTETDNWSRAYPPMPVPRSAHGACAVGDSIYVVGGGERHYWLSAVDRLNLQTEQWEYVAHLPCRRSNFGLTRVGRRIFACGGWDGASCLSSVDQFDLVSMQWKPMGYMNNKRSSVDVCAVEVSADGTEVL